MSLEIVAAIAVVGLAILFGMAIVLVTRRRRVKATEETDRHPRAAADRPSPEAAVAPEAFGDSKPHPLEAAAELPRLMATGGPLAQRTFAIPSQGLSIGRHPDNDIVLADELMVSRYHAVIVQEQGQCVLYGPVLLGSL